MQIASGVSAPLIQLEPNSGVRREVYLARQGSHVSAFQGVTLKRKAARRRHSTVTYSAQKTGGAQTNKALWQCPQDMSVHGRHKDIKYGRAHHWKGFSCATEKEAQFYCRQADLLFRQASEQLVCGLLLTWKQNLQSSRLWCVQAALFLAARTLQNGEYSDSRYFLSVIWLLLFSPALLLTIVYSL